MANPLEKFFEDSLAGAGQAVLDDDLQAIARSDSNASWLTDPVSRGMQQSAKHVVKSQGDRLHLERFNQDLAQIAFEHPQLLRSRDARAIVLADLAEIAIGNRKPVHHQPSIFSTGRHDPEAKKPTNGICAYCGKPAGSSCGGCRDAPNTAERTFYCDLVCQKAHRSSHRSICTRLEQRAMLYRVGNMLRDLVYLLRSKAYPHDVDRVDEKNGILYLYTKAKTAEDDLFPFRPVPAQLTKIQDIKETSLVVQYCKEFLRDFYLLTRSLLEGMYSDIQEVRVRVKNARRPTGFVELDGRVQNNMFHRHAVLRVTLRSGEIYCVDATGAQFGWKEPVMPWDDFVSTRVWLFCETGAFGAQLTKEITRATRQGSSSHAALLDGSVAYAITAYVIDWLKIEAIDSKKLLKLPSARFEEKRSQLLAFASVKLDGYLEQLKRDTKWAMLMIDGKSSLALLPGFTKTRSYGMMQRFMHAI